MLPLLFAAVTAESQTVILEESLIDKNLSENFKKIVSPSGYQNWIFDNCWTVNSYVQVSSSSGWGALITRKLSNLDKIAILSFDVLGVETNQVIGAFAVNGEQEETVVSKTISAPDKWNSCSAVVRNGSDDTRIKFAPISNGENGYCKFQVRNILVKNLDGCLYYETFDKYEGKGGGDETFTDLSVLYNTTSANCDNPATTFSGSLKSGANCIYFSSSKNSSIYTTALVPQPESGRDVVLSFRIAGSKDEANVTVQHNGMTLLNQQAAQNGQWTEMMIPITNFDFSKPIAISGNYVYLDDVMVSAMPAIRLDESIENGSVIDANSEKYVNVSLTRTLKADIWNTMCVPFEMSRTALQNAGSGVYTIEMRRLRDVTNGVFEFFTDNTIPAGEPFLVKTDREFANPTFKGVKIEVTEPQAVGSNGYFLQGIFSPTELKTDGTNLFLGTDGYLYAPAEGSNTMNGMRAYLVTPGGTSGSVRVRLVDDDDQLAGISTVPTAGRRDATIYTLSGQALGTNPNTLPQGIYVKGNKKVFIK